MGRRGRRRRLPNDLPHGSVSEGAWDGHAAPGSPEDRQGAQGGRASMVGGQATRAPGDHGGRSRADRSGASPWIFPSPSNATKPVDAAFIRYKGWYKVLRV